MLFHFPLKFTRVVGGVYWELFVFIVGCFPWVFVGFVLGCLSRCFCWAVGWVPYVYSEALYTFLCT
jgi:hypothetical protein